MKTKRIQFFLVLVVVLGSILAVLSAYLKGERPAASTVLDAQESPPSQMAKERDDFVQADRVADYSFTPTDIQVAKQDYLKFDSSLSALPDSQYLERLDRAFESELISEADAVIYALLTDQGLSRGATIATLWAAIDKSGPIPNRQLYLLDSLASLSPIELVDEMNRFLLSCEAPQCTEGALRVLESIALTYDTWYEKLEADNQRYAYAARSKATEVLRSLLAQEMPEQKRELLNSFVPSFLSGDEADVFLSRDSNVTAFRARLTNALSDASPSPAKLTELLSQTDTYGTEEKKEFVTEVISAAVELPMTPELGAQVASFLERNEPDGSEPPVYYQWFVGYTSALGLRGDSDGYQKFINQKIGQASVPRKLSLLVSAPEVGHLLSPALKESLTSSLQQIQQQSPVDSPEYKQAKFALTKISQ